MNATRGITITVLISMVVFFGLFMLVGRAFAIHTTPIGTGTLPPPVAPFTSPTFNLDQATVEAVLLRQPAPVLKFWLDRAMPRPCTLTAGGTVAVVGLITAGPGPSAIPSYISGCVVESAVKVQVRVNDLMPYYDVVPTLTMLGHAKSWRWVVPDALQDGRSHKLYVRAIRASGTVIGPLDNAKAATQWPFKIGAGAVVPVPVPPPVPTPTPVPPTAPFKVGTITLAPWPGLLAGAVILNARSVKLVVDGSEVLGATVTTGSGGIWSWTIPPGLRNGADHLVSATARDSAGASLGELDNSPFKFRLGTAPVGGADVKK